MIEEGADHMYAGQEDRVAQVIASWADTLTQKKASSENAANKVVNSKVPNANLLWWKKEL